MKLNDMQEKLHQGKEERVNVEEETEKKLQESEQVNTTLVRGGKKATKNKGMLFGLLGILGKGHKRKLGEDGTWRNTWILKGWEEGVYCTAGSICQSASLAPLCGELGTCNKNQMILKEKET